MPALKNEFSFKKIVSLHSFSWCAFSRSIPLAFVSHVLCCLPPSLPLLKPFFLPHGPFSSFVAFAHISSHLNTYSAISSQVLRLEKTRCLSFLAWVTLFNRSFPSSIHFPASFIISFFIIAEHNPPPFHYSFIHGWLSKLVLFPGCCKKSSNEHG